MKQIRFIFKAQLGEFISIYFKHFKYLRAMKVLIINTTIDETKSSRLLTGVDSAITSELYYKYRVNSSGANGGTDPYFHITANHSWSKYIFIDEKKPYIGTFRTMNELIGTKEFLGNCLILTHEQWLDKQNPKWKTVPRYQYW